MDRCAGAAARLPGSDRKNLAIQALAGLETVSGLAARHGVSRKFVYQQTHKARIALAYAFSPAASDSGVIFELTVTKVRLRQVIVGLTLVCHGSYCGVVEFLRDLLGMPASVCSVHNVLQSATRQSKLINHDQDLSGIRVGLHDEVFQGATPVLAGVDAASTYCYLLAAEQRSDANTWSVHLLDAAQQVAAVRRAMADTPRSRSLVENLNSRLRPYFTLRRHLGNSYLDLLRFFLNHSASCAADASSARARARAN